MKIDRPSMSCIFCSEKPYLVRYEIMDEGYTVCPDLKCQPCTDHYRDDQQPDDQVGQVEIELASIYKENDTDRRNYQT